MAVVLALAAAFVVWIVIDRTGADSSGSDAKTAVTRTSSTTGPAAIATPVGPTLVSKAELSSAAKTIGHPIYWAGPIAGHVYEYTLTSSGRAYVRYLPKGTKVGDPKSSYLIVATYPFPKAYAALKALAKKNAIPIAGKGIAVVDSGYPQSVHFAFPGVAYQGEVYDPNPAKARQVATSGDIVPVG